MLQHGKQEKKERKKNKTNRDREEKWHGRSKQKKKKNATDLFEALKSDHALALDVCFFFRIHFHCLHQLCMHIYVGIAQVNNVWMRAFSFREKCDSAHRQADGIFCICIYLYGGSMHHIYLGIGLRVPVQSASCISYYVLRCWLIFISRFSPHINGFICFKQI